MTRTRYKIYNYQQPHFLTRTVVEWIPLFANPEFVSVILYSLRFLQKERCVTLYACVIMEHHLYLRTGTCKDDERIQIFYREEDY